MADDFRNRVVRPLGPTDLMQAMLGPLLTLPPKGTGGGIPHANPPGITAFPLQQPHTGGNSMGQGIKSLGDNAILAALMKGRGSQPQFTGDSTPAVNRFLQGADMGLLQFPPFPPQDKLGLLNLPPLPSWFTGG